MHIDKCQVLRIKCKYYLAIIKIVYYNRSCDNILIIVSLYIFSAKQAAVF